MIIALGMFGACFGVIAFSLLVAVIPKLIDANRQIDQLTWRLDGVEKSFAEGLQELVSQYESDRTGLYMQTVDPVTRQPAVVKALDKELDLDQIESLIHNHEARQTRQIYTR